MTRIVTAQMDAYLWSSIWGPEDLHGDPDAVIPRLRFVPVDGAAPSTDYIKVGRATVEVGFFDDKAVIAEKVAALKREKEQTLAAAQSKATDIERQIQQLLAIEYDGSES